MPYFHVRTNSRVEHKAVFLKRCSEVVAEALGKSERFVMTSVDDEIPMTFGGSIEPCAYIELKSIGLRDDTTRDLSRIITDTVRTHLGIQGDRIYVEFSGAERGMWGWNGDTFAK